jgi:hypothetical protein
MSLTALLGLRESEPFVLQYSHSHLVHPYLGMGLTKGPMANYARKNESYMLSFSMDQAHKDADRGYYMNPSVSTSTRLRFGGCRFGRLFGDVYSMMRMDEQVGRIGAVTDCGIDRDIVLVTFHQSNGWVFQLRRTAVPATGSLAGNPYAVLSETASN